METVGTRDVKMYFFYGSVTLSIRWVVTTWIRVICQYDFIYVKVYANFTTGNTISILLDCGSSISD